MRKRVNRFERELSPAQIADVLDPLQEFLSKNRHTLATNEKLIFGQIGFEVGTADLVVSLSAPDRPEDCIFIRGMPYTRAGADSLDERTTFFNLFVGDKNVGRGLHYQTNGGDHNYFVWLFPPLPPKTK